MARLTNPTSTVLTNVALNYFSYLGGAKDDAGLAITVDSAAGALVTGWTQSADFPVFPIQSHSERAERHAGCVHRAVEYGRRGGPDNDGIVGELLWRKGPRPGHRHRARRESEHYFAGDTNSTDLQVKKPITLTGPVNDENNNGGYDAFVTQLGTAVSLSVNGVLTLGTNQTFITAGNQATFTYTVTNNGPDPATN